MIAIMIVIAIVIVIVIVIVIMIVIMIGTGVRLTTFDIHMYTVCVSQLVGFGTSLVVTVAVVVTNLRRPELNHCDHQPAAVNPILLASLRQRTMHPHGAAS